MRTLAGFLFLAVTAFSLPSYAEVQMVKAKHRDITTSSQVLVARYETQIEVLDRESDHLGAKILSKKSGLSTEDGPSRDGLEVVLVRAGR